MKNYNSAYLFLSYLFYNIFNIALNSFSLTITNKKKKSNAKLLSFIKL